MIKVYGIEETKNNYIEKIPYGGRFKYGDCVQEGANIGKQQAPTKELVKQALEEIDKIFPIHWCNVKIFCVPLQLMSWTEKHGFAGGMGGMYARAWRDVIILGARPKYTIREVAGTLIHEIAHIFHQEFIDDNLFDVMDTKEYTAWKKIMGLKGRYDHPFQEWEDRPLEVLAELIRYYAGQQNDIFNADPYRTFDEPHEPKPVKEAFDYLMSFIPPKDDEKIEKDEEDMKEYETVVELQIGNKIMKINGEEEELRIAPFLKHYKEYESATCTELRPIFEKMGYEVLWDDETKTATIRK